MGIHKPGDTCSLCPAANVLGIKGASEQGQVEIILLLSRSLQILLLREVGMNAWWSARGGYISCQHLGFLYSCRQRDGHGFNSQLVDIVYPIFIILPD